MKTLKDFIDPNELFQTTWFQWLKSQEQYQIPDFNLEKIFSESEIVIEKNSLGHASFNWKNGKIILDKKWVSNAKEDDILITIFHELVHKADDISVSNFNSFDYWIEHLTVETDFDKNSKFYELWKPWNGFEVNAHTVVLKYFLMEKNMTSKEAVNTIVDNLKYENDELNIDIQKWLEQLINDLSPPPASPFREGAVVERKLADFFTLKNEVPIGGW
jgi:hypothetical protein